jgi:hypothetical protein
MFNEETDKLFYGIVESVDDPTNLGRGKVRWFIPSHVAPSTPRPTETLPWVQLAKGIEFSVPPVGTIVMGYFEDGGDFKKPQTLDIIPKYNKNIPKELLDYGTFLEKDVVSPTSQQSLDRITKQAEIQKAPVQPEHVVDGKKSKGVSWSLSAQGIVAGTGISVTNTNISHVCDFRYNLDFDIGLTGLLNPITAITQAIKNGKNNAANIIAMMIKKLSDTISAAIKAIVKAAGLDPTGTVSTIYARVTGVLQDINDFIKDVAEFVEIASTIYYLVKNINDIITYLQSLPARFLAIVQDCITRFLNGAKQFAAQVAAIPGQIGATVDSLASSIQASADELLGQQQSELNSITIPDNLKTLFNDPHLDHSNTIIQFVSDTYGNSNTVMATAESNNYDPTKVQWA